MKVWAIASCYFKREQELAKLLGEGWEPFAVTAVGIYAATETIWLRRLEEEGNGSQDYQEPQEADHFSG